MNLIPWLAVLVAVGLIAFLVHRFFRGDSIGTEHGGEGDWPLPPIVFPTARGKDGAEGANGPAGGNSRSAALLGGDRRGFRPATNLGTPASPSEWSSQQAAPPSHQPRQSRQPTPSQRPPEPPQPPQPHPQTTPAVRPTSALEPAAGESGEKRGPLQSLVDAAPIPDGTLQLLPGRLEVVGEDGEQAEVRFVRVPGKEPEVTFGRSEGPPHQHIQLHAPTVSRMHARLRFEDGRWTLSNLSRTNPVVINGGDMADDETERPLRDGDRIEMGEVAFVFHSR